MTDIHTITKMLFEPGDIVEGRCIKGKKPNVHIQKFWTTAAELPSMADDLEALNQQGYNIYFGPNPRKEAGKSGDDNVLMARCLFVDYDNIEPGDGCGMFEFCYTDIFLAGLPEPTLGIHSGHGIHVYWRLAEPIHDLDLWRSMQSQLIERLGSDKSIKNPERIMRMPGYMNTKKEPFQDCFICWGVSYASI